MQDKTPSCIIYHRNGETGASATLPYWDTKATLAYVRRNYRVAPWKPHLVVKLKSTKGK